MDRWMSSSRRLDDYLAQLRDRLGLRAKSLIVTVYGDAILPHGGTVWLGSLIRLVEPFGLSDRIVRTAVFRLAKEDFLVSNQIGRRSYYSMTHAGRHRTDAVHRRMYGPAQRSWNGEWCIVTLLNGDVAGERRERLRRELAWMGFGAMAPSVMAHPSADLDAVRELLQDLDLADKVVVMRSASLSSTAALRGLVSGSWDLERIATAYNGFLEHFRPVWRMLQAAPALDPKTCFIARILLIHDFRRVLLRDPMLPDELLPSGWAGTASRVLCRNLYRLLCDPAEKHLMSVLETAEGPIPEAAPHFYTRFNAEPRPEPADAPGLNNPSAS